MRLTADLIQHSAIFVNCLKDRQVDLRGNKIAQIENLGILSNQVDTIDLSDNEIRKIENFPLMKRLTSLILCNNLVNSIDENVINSIPDLKCLVLTNNRMNLLSDLDSLVGFTRLEQLSLVNNPVCLRSHYRLYVIHKIPSLKVLDFTKVKRIEREQAKELFTSGAGKALANGMKQLKSNNQANKLSEDDIARIKVAIASAKTPEQVEKLEKSLKAGIIPDDSIMNSSKRKATTPAVVKPAKKVALEKTVEAKQTANGKDSTAMPKQPTNVAESKTSSKDNTTAGDEKTMDSKETVQEEEKETNDTIMDAEGKEEGLSEEKMQWLDSLKVAELKSELKKAGLSEKGRKAILKERLLEHLMQNK